jgi:putative membrane protein
MPGFRGSHSTVMESAMRTGDSLAVLIFTLCLTAPTHGLPVVRIAQAGTDHHSAATVASDTADYIRNSAIGDLFEIAAAKVARKTTHNDDIRRFSQMLIDDHTTIQETLAATLRQAEFAMTLPSSLDAPHDAIVRPLEDAAVKNFDLNFMQQQIAAMESALRVQTTYARKGRDLTLRRFASQTIPKIEMHLALAERIFQQLSPKTASVRR